MKRLKSVLLVTFLAVVLFTVTACGKDTLVGKWKHETSNYVYTFNEDGTGDYSGMKFTYTTEGAKLSILYDGSTSPFETIYTIEGKKLTIKDSNGSDVVYNKQ